MFFFVTVSRALITALDFFIFILFSTLLGVYLFDSALP